MTKNNPLITGINLKEISELIGAKLLGDTSRLVHSFCSLSEPVKDGLSFSKAGNSKDLKKALSKGLLSAVIVPKEIEGADKTIAQLIVADPLAAISLLTKKYLGLKPPPPGVSKLADVHASARIGDSVHIGAFCSVGEGVVIGDHAVLYPHVVVYENVTIGENAIIHSGAVVRESCKIGPFCIVQNGAVIGADGFGYFMNPEKHLQAVPQVGNVELSAEVEVGANACIDRATLGTTAIGFMTKIDNLVQIGHNTKIGQASIICGNVGIAGSCEIGDQVTLGGGAGVADHVSIVSGTRIGGNSGVTSDIKEPADYVGYPVVKANDWRRQAVSIEKLPEFMSEIRNIIKTKVK